MNCTGLATIKFPDTVREINGNAFDSCGSLTSVTLSKSLQNLGSEAFRACSNISAFYIPSDNHFFSSSGGVLYDKNLTQLLIYPQKKQGAYVIPNSITNMMCWEKAV